MHSVEEDSQVSQMSIYKAIKMFNVTCSLTCSQFHNY